MKWAIALSCGHACMFWNGQSFTTSEGEAARFYSRELAQLALAAVFFQMGYDEEFSRRYYVQAVA